MASLTPYFSLRFLDTTAAEAADEPFFLAVASNDVDDEEEEFLIHMSRVYVDTALQTRATGEVKEDQEFRLSPHFDFYGDVKMLSTDEFLTFSQLTLIHIRSQTVAELKQNEIQQLLSHLPYEYTHTFIKAGVPVM